MTNSVDQLNKICNSIPQNFEQLNNWYQNNRPAIDTHLSNFGKYIDEKCNVITGTPKFVVQTNTCAVLGWKYNSMYSDIVTVENALGSEINARKTFNTLYHLFTANNDADSRLLSNVKKVVIASKGCSLFLARRFLRFFSQIAEGHARNYRIH